MAVAGELHDEVLPPLFKVHLMGQVLRQDLNSGRLLDLDEDLPELIAATELAQSAIRSLVGDLRHSSLGPGGLNATIELLASQLEAAGSPRIRLELNDVGGSHVTQLLLYQVAREALNNAARHSRASRIEVRLLREGEMIRLVVEDDGIGFDPRSVDGESHFGLQMITERVEAGQGRVIIDSKLGGGTRILAALPPKIEL
jgi:signal transduction histidine kinase